MLMHYRLRNDVNWIGCGVSLLSHSLINIEMHLQLLLNAQDFRMKIHNLLSKFVQMKFYRYNTLAKA